MTNETDYNAPIRYNVIRKDDGQMAVVPTTPVTYVLPLEQIKDNTYAYVRPAKTYDDTDNQMPEKVREMNIHEPDSDQEALTAGIQLKKIHSAPPAQYQPITVDYIGIVAEYVLNVGAGTFPYGTPVYDVRPTCNHNGCREDTVQGAPLCWHHGLNLPEVPPTMQLQEAPH